MIFRISGGIFFLLYAVESLGAGSVPPIIMGIVALVTGIALIAGK